MRAGYLAGNRGYCDLFIKDACVVSDAKKPGGFHPFERDVDFLHVAEDVSCGIVSNAVSTSR